jgi:hypothetical protein
MSDSGVTGEATVLPPGFIQGKNGGLLRPWGKGETGNPTGMQGHDEYKMARGICAAHTVEAINKQLELMSSQDERVAFMATEAILKRGIGAPRDHSGDKPMRVDLTALSDDQRKSLAEMLRLMFGGA